MRKNASALMAAVLAATLLAGCQSATTTSDANAVYKGTTESISSTSVTDDTHSATKNEADATGTDTQTETPDPKFDNSKIVRNVQATVSSRDFDKASAKADEIISSHNALVVDDDYNADKALSHRTRDLTLRIASDEVDAIVSEIKSADAWVVKDVSVSAADMSASYHDNEARIKALRERYDFYQKKAQEATDEKVMMEMTENMMQTLDQIEALESQNRQTDVDVAWSTLDLHIAYDTSAKSLDTSEDVGQTLADSITVLPSNIAAAFGRFLILLIALLPYALIVGIIVLVCVLASKAYRKSHPKPERPEPKPRPERPSRRERKAKPAAERKPTGNFATHEGDADARGAENADATDREGPKDDDES